MRSIVSETTHRPREDRVVVESGPNGHLVLTLRAGRTGTARSLALFAAAAMENMVRGLPGFTGAAFMISQDDRLFLELMAWESAAMLAAASGDHPYADHRNILRLNSEVLQRVASSCSLAGAPLPFERGDHVAARGFWLPAGDPLELTRKSHDAPGGCADMVLLASQGSEAAASVIAIAKDRNDLPHSPGVREGPCWEGRFDIVEVVSGDSLAARRAVRYRLSSVSDTGGTASDDRTHA